MLLATIFLQLLLSANASLFIKQSQRVSPKMTLQALLKKPVRNYIDDSGRYQPVFNSYNGEVCNSEQFINVGIIAEGKTSIIHHALYKGRPVVVKTLLFPVKAKHVKMEEILLHKLDHPNITKGICTFRDPDGSIRFAMEYTSLLTLSDRLSQKKSDDPSNQRKFAHQMADVLLYLHTLNIFHNDIKPENIVVDDDWSIKLIDFGLSVYRPKGVYSKCQGTLDFMSPEKLLEQEYDNGVDWYAFGITLYELFYKTTPFEAIESIKELEIVVQAGIPGLKDSTIDDLISKLCNPDRKLRWCLANGNRQDILSHPFIDDQSHALADHSETFDEFGPIESLDSLDD